MEVNEYWNDRNAPERVGRVLVELGAGQMEQPVKMKAGKVLKPETGRTTVRRATRIIGHLTRECQVMLRKFTPIAMRRVENTTSIALLPLMEYSSSIHPPLWGY
ncbi:hypothetical protein EHN06_03225 [Marinobacter sp. NP-4(2019)]|uniref:hypothetical protein n=1 Tax=Marinobacter sp. NP-4(2019) TaxID=2488665 RepID=UPI000FC3CCB5|nr:hypothetical protein [Marinobacter sp. NP-4(2019)]AZT82632.1 hypothetical protein EHN06_03225 [Marinobacter sp. NP-4(2019)]